MRSGNPFGVCKNCGKQIMWIRTKAGNAVLISEDEWNIFSDAMKLVLSADYK